MKESGLRIQHNLTSRCQHNDHPDGTKKRRMHCIVVSRLPAVFHRLMVLDYQIGLNFASRVES